MVPVRLALQAMACRFELVLHGDDAVRLRAAGEEALAEIQRLEAQLSFYRPSSEVSRINARAAAGPVPVEPRLFRLLQRAQHLHAATQGAFDPTIAPLMRCWDLAGGAGGVPDADALTEARRRTGMDLVTLNEADYTVAFARPGVMLDLGAIGKGYAVDEAVGLLAEAGVTSALLHGGTSTAYALGVPPDASGWKVALPHPATHAAAARPGSPQDDLLAVVALRDEALSVSAVWGKTFTADGATYGHVLDPRSGRPVEGAVLAAVAMPSATDADALSTALLVLARDGLGRLARHADRLRALVVCPGNTPGGFDVWRHGLPTADTPTTRTLNNRKNDEPIR